MGLVLFAYPEGGYIGHSGINADTEIFLGHGTEGFNTFSLLVAEGNSEGQLSDTFVTDFSMKADTNLQNLFDTPSINPIRLLTLSSFSSIETRQLSGETPGVDPGFTDINSIPDAERYKDPKSRLSSRSTDLLPSNQSFYAPTPDGRAVIIDPLADQVKVLNIFGETEIKYQVSSGSFSTAINVTCSNEYIYIIHLRSVNFNGGDRFRIEQRYIEDGELVEYSYQSEGLNSFAHLLDESVYFKTESDILFSKPFVNTNTDIDFLYGFLSDTYFPFVSSDFVGTDTLLTDYTGFNSDTLLDDLTGLNSDTELFLDSLEEGFNTDTEIYPYTPFDGTDFVFTYCGLVLTEIESATDGVNSDVEILSIRAEGWFTIVDKLQSGTKEDPGPDNLDIDILNRTFDADDMKINRWSKETYRFESDYINDPYARCMDFDFPHFTHRRNITNPLIEASETCVYLLCSSSRGATPKRDNLLTGLEKRTPRGTLYRLDPITKWAMPEIKPKQTSMTGAFGKSAKDGVGFCLVDTFWDVSSSSYDDYKTGDLVIFNDQLEIIYDENYAIHPTAAYSWIYVVDIGTRNYRNEVVRSMPLMARQGSIIHVGEGGIYLVSDVRFQDGGTYKDRAYVVIKLYNPSDMSATIFRTGSFGAILSSGIYLNPVWIKTDTDIFPSDSYSYVNSLTELVKGKISAFNSDTTFQVENCIASDTFLDSLVGMKSDVSLKHQGFRRIDSFISNVVPAQFPLQYNKKTTITEKYEDKAMCTYPNSVKFWERSSVLNKNLDDVIGWKITEETAMFEESTFPKPVQYVTDGTFIFGISRIFEENTLDRTIMKKTVPYTDEEFQNDWVNFDGYVETTFNSTYQLSTGSGYSFNLGGYLMKFNGINTLPESTAKLPGVLYDSVGNQYLFQHRHIGIDKTNKKVFVIRTAGSIDSWALDLYKNIYNERMNFYIDPNKLGENFNWFNYYETFNYNPLVYFYGTIQEKIDDSIHFLFNREKNQYLQRDILVYDYELSIVDRISTINGLDENDVIQHVFEKDGMFYVLAQSYGVTFDWESIPFDLDYPWSISDPTNEDYIDQYKDKYIYGIYSKLKLYTVPTNLKTGTASLLYEFGWGTTTANDVIIQEVTDTHIWINWDGVRKYRTGGFLGIGVKLDGSGYDEVPGLIAIVKDIYQDGYQLICWTENAPKFTKYNTGVFFEFPNHYGYPFECQIIERFKENFYTDSYTDLYDTLYQLNSNAQSFGIFGDPTFFILEGDNLTDYHVIDDVIILNEKSIEYLTSEIADFYQKDYPLLWFEESNEFFATPYIDNQPGYSQFIQLKLYDWVKTDTTLKAIQIAEKPATWINVTNGNSLTGTL